MKPHSKFTALVTSERDTRANFKTMASSVLPRPVAFVSTISADGVPNLAPFSFFNAVGTNPPAVMFSPATKSDGTTKDTLANLAEVREFVVNIVSHEMAEAMNVAAGAFPPEVNEFDSAGFTALPSQFVKPHRVAESPVHLECKLLQIVPVGDGPLSGNICIGRVLCFHIADDHLLDDGCTVDVARIDAIGRLGGADYATIRDRFAMAKPRA